jgi:hypothetical protein
MRSSRRRQHLTQHRAIHDTVHANAAARQIDLDHTLLARLIDLNRGESDRGRLCCASLSAPPAQQRDSHTVALRDLTHRCARLATLGDHLLALFLRPLAAGTSLARHLRTALGFHLDSPLHGISTARENPKYNQRTLDGADRTLTDDLGFSVDWTLTVKYTVKLGNAGAPVYEGEKVTRRNTAKFANVSGALNETIKLNVEEVIKDTAFVSAIK